MIVCPALRSFSTLMRISHQLIYGKESSIRGCGAVVGPRINLSMAWNLCFDASHGQILFHGGDDLIFRTEDWDEYVKLQFRLSKDKIIFVGGQDGFHAPEKNFLTMDFSTGTGLRLSDILCPPTSHQTLTTPG